MSDAPTTSTPTPTSTDAEAPAPAVRQAPWATSPLSFFLSVAGVLALVIGLMTPWVDVVVDRGEGDAQLQAAIDMAIEDEYGSANPIGITLDDGALVVVLSVAFLALLAIHHRRGRRGRGLPIAALMVAALLTLIGVGNVGDVGTTSDEVQTLLPVTIDVAFGLYLTVVGGVLAVCGGAIAAAKAEAKQPTSVV